MKESYAKDLASHLGPESCGAVRKDSSEVLTGEDAGEPLSREIQTPELPTLLSEAEGNTPGTIRQELKRFGAVVDLSMHGHFMDGNWEIPELSGSRWTFGARCQGP